MGFFSKPKEIKEKLLIKEYEVLKNRREAAEAAQEKAMRLGLEIINLQLKSPGNPRIRTLEKEQRALLALAAKIPTINIEILKLAKQLYKTEAS